MSILTRSSSATFSNKQYFTPQTPSPVHPRAFADMTPLPSLFDKIVKASKEGERPASLQLRSKAEDPLALPSIPEESDHPSSNSVEDCDVRSTSDAATEVGDEPEPEPVAHHPLATDDPMDYEEDSIDSEDDPMDWEATPTAFSEPLGPNLPPVAPIWPPAPAYRFVHGETPAFLSNQPHIFQYPEPPVTQSPANREPFMTSELNNSATSPYPTAYHNFQSTSLNPGPYFLPQQQAAFLPPQPNKQSQQVQFFGHNTMYTQCPIHPPPIYLTTPPILYASEPVRNTMHPVTLPALAQSFPTYPYQNPQRQVPNTPSEPPSLARIYGFPMSAPEVQGRPAQYEVLTRWPHPPRLSSWRLRQRERQMEMDKIAAPYLARLREVALRKKVEAEARALAGDQKADRASEEGVKSWWDFFWGDRKVQKEHTKAERQQRSEERRQTRNDFLRRKRRSKSGENTPPEGLKQEVPASPRRKSAGRPKPYSIPQPEARSPRRSHIMPGGFDFDEPTPGLQAGIFPDADAIWKGLRSFVDAGYKLWTQD